MNKTAICINILQILNSRGVVNANELAEIVETNVRNISEYIKELQICGYNILSKKGVSGGYYLDQKELFPVLKLSDPEKQAFLDGVGYLNHRRDFLGHKIYNLAISKISCAINSPNAVNPITIYDRFPLAMDNELLTERYNLINEAILDKKKILVSYIGNTGIEKEHILHPYKAYIFNNSWCLLAWNQTINRMGYFKINRIEKISILPYNFTILKTFNENDYFDSFGMKQYGEYYHVRVEFKNVNTAISERIYGKNQTIEVIDANTVILSCDMQNKDLIISFLLGFGANAKVLEPEWLKQEMITTIERISENYRI